MNGLGLGVLPGLQVGVDHVVHGVQFVAGQTMLARRRGRVLVGLNALAPQSQAGEDVRRHVQGVGRVRRDPGVAARCWERRRSARSSAPELS